MAAPTTTTWALAPAPKYAGMRSWDCTFCDHEALQRPVFLTDGAGVIAAGSGCAALALGRPRSAGRKLVDEAAALTRQAEQRQAQRDELAASAQRALDAWNDGARGEMDDDVERMRRNYCTARQSGRLPEGLLLPAYIAQVADAGEVYPW